MRQTEQEDEGKWGAVWGAQREEFSEVHTAVTQHGGADTGLPGRKPHSGNQEVTAACFSICATSFLLEVKFGKSPLSVSLTGRMKLSPQLATAFLWVSQTSLLLFLGIDYECVT